MRDLYQVLRMIAESSGAPDTDRKVSTPIYL